MKEPTLKDVMAELQELRKELRFSHRSLMPIEEAAVYLGISPKTIRNGLGPAAKHPFPIRPVKLGGRVLFEKKSLDSFIDGLVGAAE
jgi:hypothetical protein